MKSKLVLIILFVLLLAVHSVSAQTTTDNPFIVTIKVESAFARALPAFEAEPTSSLFQDNRVEVVARNLDATWFQVKRPGRLTNLGWVFNEILNRWTFKPEDLPLGDFVTGVIGPKPLTEAPAFAAFLIEGPTLRNMPSRRGGRIMDIPPSVTVPVLERNQDGSWLRINYLGYDGWISAFTARDLPNVMDVPQGLGLPPLETIQVVVIPVEIQQAQIDRLREFIYTRRELAFGLETFWWSVFRGEIMPCDAPVEITYYPYGDEDVRELPELQRYAPRLATAIDYMNTSREPLLSCGVIKPETVGDARDSAINARIIFDATLEAIQDLEENVVQTRR